MPKRQNASFFSSFKKRRLEAYILFVFISFSAYFILSDYPKRLLDIHNLSALVEMLIVFLLLLTGFYLERRFEKPRFRLILLSLVLLTSLYLHRMLLPFLLSAVYFFFISTLALLIFGRRPKHVFACLFRNLSEGVSDLNYPYLLLPLLLIQLNRMNIAADYDSLRYGLRTPYVLLQGDTLPQLVKSFFTGLGMLNSVYAYPKGLELLSAPLCTFHSFALLFMFQFWTMLASMALMGSLVYTLYGSKKRAWLSIILMASFCSVSNMSITAKTDLATLFLQLAMIYLFIKGEKTRAVGAAILSYSMKPTSLVFTTVAAFALFLGLALISNRSDRNKHRLDGKTREDRIAISPLKIDSQETDLRQKPRELKSKSFNPICVSSAPPLLALFFSLIYTGIITLRTLLITGVPVSTTFTAFFQAIGFHVKWPFNLDADLSYGQSQGVFHGFISMLKRLFCFLFCPLGEDMSHVSIAWGGVFIPVLLYFAISFLLSLSKRGRSKNETSFLITVLFLCLSAVSLLTFYFLWQVDGNYYILWHCVLLIFVLGCTAALPEHSIKEQDHITGFFINDIGLTHHPLHRINYIFFLLYICTVLNTLMTSWKGTIGFTEIDLINKGYYDNKVKIEEFEKERGSSLIWQFLAFDPKKRVIAYAESPECYYFPCVLQGINDVEGSGGSPGLYDHPMYFEWFLKWAEAEYIYIEKGFLDDHSEGRTSDMVKTLAMHGMLKNFMIEGSPEPDEAAYLLIELDQDRLQYVWDKEQLAPPADEKVVDEAMDKLNQYAYRNRTLSD